jgi:23S rRNA pseudouridine1911/1915/1917 synthase
MVRTDLIIVEADQEGERLDVFLAAHYDDLSRSMIKRLILESQVLIDGQPCKASHILKCGECIDISIPPPQEIQLLPRDIPLEIIYEDEALVVINKPQGLVVHPAQGNWDYTLVNALLYHIKDLSGINGKLRPGIVHRLDKDTSGVMVIAKNDSAHRHLSEQIKNHTLLREYYALVHGNIPEQQGIIDAPIGRSKEDRKKMAVMKEGRPSQSQYQVLERFKNYTLVRVRLLTGRTHQIRVHFAYIRHGVVGDPIYGSGKKHFDVNAQVLHAFLLGFQHPNGENYLEFTAPCPDYFQALIEELRNS